MKEIQRPHHLNCNQDQKLRNDLTSLTEPGVEIREKYQPLSDGACIRTFEFIPLNLKEDRPVILFVAGWISLISAWQEVLKVITPHFRTIYVETREKRSALMDRQRATDFSIRRMTLDLAETVEQCIPRGQPFCLAGSSLGSTIILEYLALNRGRPLLSIAIAPNAEFSIPRWFFPIARLLPPATYPIVREGIKWYLRTYRVDSVREREQSLKYERSLDAADPRRLKANALAMKGYSLWPRLKDIGDPVIIVAARTDTLHVEGTLQRMAEVIPGARLETMESNRETHSEKAGQFILQEIEASMALHDRSGGARETEGNRLL